MGNATRDIILRTLRGRSQCSVMDLAEAAGISPVSVRHHLANLQADGLVEVDEVKHGVGRPRHVFKLTEAALELFPARYLRLTSRLLAEIKDSMDPGKVEQLFSAVAASMAAEYARKLERLPFKARVQKLAELLSLEGFEAEVERQGDRVTIRELACPYFKMSREHPEVCLIDRDFIATALSLPVERVTCLLHGDADCSFSLPINAEIAEAMPNER
jgi:DeoR family suf operon transcriptional repressor